MFAAGVVDVVRNPEASDTTALLMVSAASLLTAIAASAAMSAFTITPAEIAVTPALDTVMSPVKVCATGLLLESPIQIFPLGREVGCTIPLPETGINCLVPRTVQLPLVTKAIS